MRCEYTSARTKVMLAFDDGHLGKWSHSVRVAHFECTDECGCVRVGVCTSWVDIKRLFRRIGEIV